MNRKIPDELQLEISMVEKRIKVMIHVLNQKLNLVLFLQILFKLISVFCSQGR